MKKTKFTEAAMAAAAVRECECGTPVASVARKLGVSDATLYIWKKKYAGMGVANIRKMRQLEEENGKLKRLVADLAPRRRAMSGRVDLLGESRIRALYVWGSTSSMARI